MKRTDIAILITIAIIAISATGGLIVGSIVLTNTATGWNANQLTHNPITGKVNTIKVPHVFMNNDSSVVTMDLTASWTTFAPSVQPYFTFVGMANVDSLANDTMQLMYSGHYWFMGGISIGANSQSIWVKSRLFNATQNRPIEGRHSVTLNGAGNHVTLPINGYCTFCHDDDKIVLQLFSEQNITVTIYDGNISFWGNHGY
jgi:hypothetical protein